MLADQLALDLPMSSAAPALARRAVERLGLEGMAGDNVLLMASELVSNALRHSGAGAQATIHLAVGIHDGALRMSVTDAGGGFAPGPETDRADPGVNGGFGLFLVEQLADSWGVDRATVWAVMRLGAA